MGHVIAGMAMSLDGFVQDRNGDTGPLLASGFDEYMTSDAMQEQVATTGAVAMGRKSFHMSSDYAEYEFQVPLFILTHHVPTTLPKGASEKLSFNFVRDGVESLIRQARAAAGDKNVVIVGGADTIQQCLKARLVDELQITLMPVLLGDGLRFFEHLGHPPIRLEKIKAVDAPGGITDLSFRVLK